MVTFVFMTNLFPIQHDHLCFGIKIKSMEILKFMFPHIRKQALGQNTIQSVNYIFNLAHENVIKIIWLYFKVLYFLKHNITLLYSLLCNFLHWNISASKSFYGNFFDKPFVIWAGFRNSNWTLFLNSILNHKFIHKNHIL